MEALTEYYPLEETMNDPDGIVGGGGGRRAGGGDNTVRMQQQSAQDSKEVCFWCHKLGD